MPWRFYFWGVFTESHDKKKSKKKGKTHRWTPVLTTLTTTFIIQVILC